jgi:hypothetical protein
MKKVVKLTESELTKMVKRIINEDMNPDGIPKNHPVNNRLYQEMTSNVEGEGVVTIKYIPNKMLVIDANGTKYTITKG